MKSIYSTFITFLYLLGSLVLWSVGAAQAQSGTPSLQAEAADSTYFPEVAVPVTVRDANGVPWPDLTRDNFVILEGSIDSPRPITGVSTQVNPEAQLSLMLVIDVSGSMRGEPLANAKAAAISLLQQLGPQDQAALIAFADQIDQDSLDATREMGFTTDKAALIALIDGLEADGGTPLYDALYKGVRLTDQTDLGHRAILLLTDGVDEDPGSRWASQESPIQEAQRANLPVFTISLGDRTDPGYLERIARTTGGAYQVAPDSAALSATFQNVIDRLKQQYIITYLSGYDCDGQQYRVEVRLDVSGRTVSSSAVLGPLPNNQGCNSQAVVTPTFTPTPSATATTIVTATPTPSPTTVTATTITTTPTSTALSDPDNQDNEQTFSIWPFVLGTVVLGGGGLLLLFRRRAPERYCQRCGYHWEPQDVVCPQCGEKRVSKGLRE